MALAESILELTKFMSSEDAKKTFENLLEKEPTFEQKLREGVLRQSDYDRQMNKSKEETDKAHEDAQKWKDWAKDNVPIHEQLVKSYGELEKTQKELQEKLTAAQAARAATGDDTVNAAELEARVKEEVGKLGYVSKTEMDRVIAEQTVKMAKEEAKREIDAAQKQFYEVTVPATTNFAMDAAEISMSHMREFEGQPLDRKQFSEFMTERKQTDIKKAYEEYVKPQRDKIALDAEVTKQVKARQKELEQQYSAAGMPGGGLPPGLQEKGAVQMRLEKDQAETRNNMATTIAARAAAAELVSEGKI